MAIKIVVENEDEFGVFGEAWDETLGFIYKRGEKSESASPYSFAVENAHLSLEELREIVEFMEGLKNGN